MYRVIIVTMLLLGCRNRGGEAPRPSGSQMPRDTTPGLVRGLVIDSEEDLIPNPVERTLNRLYMLRSSVRFLQARHGVLPTTIDELVKESGMDLRMDAWATPIRYTTVSTRFELRSAGPDRVFETSDDLVATRTWLGPIAPRVQPQP